MLLNAKVTGHGPDIILLHGLFGSLENLGRVAALLSEHYTVHALDQRNHGRSPHAESMNYSLMAGDVRAYMDHAQLARAFVLGHSMGGKVAMTLALQAPERVNGLIVADIAPIEYPPHHDEIFRALKSLDLAAIKSRQDANAHLQEFGIHPDIVPFLLKNLTLDKNTGFQWRINLPVIERDYPHLMAAISSTGMYEGPVLFIAGGLSDYVRKEHEPVIRALFPAFEFKVLEGTSHWLHAEKPETFTGICQRFLQKIPAMQLGNSIRK
jgi:esterase